MLHLPLAAQHAIDDPAAAVVRRQLAAIGGLVAKAGKVVVVSGAGVSCSCGIPDFRSADGLYNLVKSRYPSTVVQGKDLFSSGLFRSPESTSLFFSFIAELKAAVDLVEPSRTHRFVRRLEERGKLARSYTQNIDGLERRAGVRCSSTLPAPLAIKAEGSSTASSEPSSAASSAWTSVLSSQASSRSPSPPPSSFPSVSTSTAVTPPADVPSSPAPPGALPIGTRIPPPELDKRSTKNVQLHGDIHALRCTVCAASYAFSAEWVELYKEGECVDCPACEDRVGLRVARGQRALSQGVLRPGIVLYDENHPSGDLIGSLQSYDIQRAPDLLLVLGTSLKVHGLKRLVKELAKAVHSLPPTKLRPDGGKGRVIFVNKTAPGKEWDGVFDAWVEGDCDDWVEGVEREWRRVRGRDFEAQSTLVGLGKAVKSTATGAEGKPKAKPKAKTATAGKAKKETNAPPTSAAIASSSIAPQATPASLVKKLSTTPLSAGPSSSALSPTKTASRQLTTAPKSMVPSSPLPMLSSPAAAPAHILSPAQRAVNVPAYFAPLAPPAFSAGQAEGSKSPKKRQRVGSIGKGKGRAYSDEEEDENSDEDILLVERDAVTGAVKLSPLGRFAALPPIGISLTPRRLPPSPSKSRVTPSRLMTPNLARATPRTALPLTANGARKRPPGTPVVQSPLMVRPQPASLALSSAPTKGPVSRAGRAHGRAETARAREGVLEAAGGVKRPAGRPRRQVEVIEIE